ncbi:MAG TPA: exosortase/archaeosortase family protein [Candidatus Acidoferrum sp.]|jgi:exosortase|nr:exosortase/archaeosortase family protein [Candidatus Acidoferrum sp.]
MTPVVETPPKSRIPWPSIVWFAVLLLVCYAPVLRRLMFQWINDEDMGHGFFVPVIALFIVWQRREELLALKLKGNPWGMLLVLASGALLIVSTLGAELFTARLSFLFTLIGVLWTLGGTLLLRKLAFPLFLMFFMVPIPAVIYNRITFPLQILASQLADSALTVLQVPVIRNGNVLELPNQKLNVVEACSGIRSLLSLTFLSLVYGYFFEKKTWVRAVLFFSTIPIAIIANGSRVTITALFTQIKAELAEGFFHEAQGWVIFMVALVFLIIWHQILNRATDFVVARRAH